MKYNKKKRREGQGGKREITKGERNFSIRESSKKRREHFKRSELVLEEENYWEQWITKRCRLS